MYVFIFLVKLRWRAEWPPIGKIAAHSVYDMFHGISTWLLVWFFPTSVFGVGIFFWLRLFLIFAYLGTFYILKRFTVDSFAADMNVYVRRHKTATLGSNPQF